MLAKVHSACLLGVEAQPVEVQVHMGQGLPGFELVGLPEAAVRESRVRVRAAISSSGKELPPQKIVVNLAPADLKKSGSSFDLAIGVAVVAACGGCGLGDIDKTLIVGELTLGAEINPVRGVLAYLRAAARFGLKKAIVPLRNAQEAALVTEIDVLCAQTFSEVLSFLDGRADLMRAKDARALQAANSIAGSQGRPQLTPDFRDVRGQHAAKRALEIAAAGRHNILLVGPPGTGKTMLAERLGSILPSPSDEERLEIATIATASGRLQSSEAGLALERPFRVPHHTISEAALLGGGDPIVAGEVTLAHRGVLFLDELPEFRRPAIEGLRITMEKGVAVVARTKHRVVMPASALVVGAMNPCPCGYYGDRRRVCRCTPERIAQYQSRISGPILDRFDMHVTVPPLDVMHLSGQYQNDASQYVESSEVIRDRVNKAHNLSCLRKRGSRKPVEAHVGKLVELTTQCTAEGLRTLNEAFEKLSLSARGYIKVLRVARTIADLSDGASRDLPIGEEHIAEALQYRLLDRAGTGALRTN